MPRIVLVRHGRAAAGWNVDPDPPLDEVGRSQALDVAAAISAESRPCAVVTSPLLRCRQTSEPLAARWGRPAAVAPDVAEIPSPAGVSMAERVDWLRAAMAGPWSALGPRYTSFRDGVVRFVLDLTDDAVVFSHFIAINAVIGAAVDDDRLVIASLDNCSRTVVRTDGGRLSLEAFGHEADTLIR